MSIASTRLKVHRFLLKGGGDMRLPFYRGSILAGAIKCIRMTNLLEFMIVMLKLCEYFLFIQQYHHSEAHYVAFLDLQRNGREF